jgi:hypothetical protein
MSSAGTEDEPLGMSGVRQGVKQEHSDLVRLSLEPFALEPDTVGVILNSWRPATIKQYALHLKKWHIFCETKNVSLTTPSIQDVLHFLTGILRTGAGYSVINTARSALSSVITFGGNVPCGNTSSCVIL